MEALSQSQAFAAAIAATVFAPPASAAADLEDFLMGPQAENAGDHSPSIKTRKRITLFLFVRLLTSSEAGPLRDWTRS